MIRKIAVGLVLSMACSIPASAAQPKAKPAARNHVVKPTVKSAKTETLSCRLGTEDRHARIAVVLVGGKTDSFAYYSKWKPRTCSIYLQRHRDPYSKWTEKGGVTQVNLERGLFLIEHGIGQYRFVFRDIDRERYCGMEGTINGTLTIRRGKEQCELAGVMDEGVPLGQAFAHLEQSQGATVAASATGVTPPAAPGPRPRRPTESIWPSASAAIGD